MTETLKAPEWLFGGPTSLGIRFCICDEVEATNPDGDGELDAMSLEAIIPMEPENIYLIGAHFTFTSEFGYPYDWWEYRAVQMQTSDSPLVRATTEEEDKIIEDSNNEKVPDEDKEEDE